MDWLFNFFQIGSLVVFVLLFAGRTAYLRVVRGINPIRVSRGKPLPEALLEGLLVAALPIWLYEAFAFAWPLPWHLFPAPMNVVVLETPLAQVAGCLLIIGGIVLFAAALLSFGDSWRVGIDRDTPGELVTGGVFAVTRNPIFLFMDAYALGTFLLNGRLLFGLFALLTFAAIHLQILREERFLADRYDQVYRAYRRRTPRYFGVVR
jgi:protein-S-isoprenylcysteine O-methyltransferase Ste14